MILINKSGHPKINYIIATLTKWTFGVRVCRHWIQISKILQGRKEVSLQLKARFFKNML